MPERTDLVVRPGAHLVSPRAKYDFQLEKSRLRLREAVAHLKERVQEFDLTDRVFDDVSARAKALLHEATPAARISENPIAWVLGGLAVGFVFGLITAPRR